jgi:hypothetical protein
MGWATFWAIFTNSSGHPARSTYVQSLSSMVVASCPRAPRLIDASVLDGWQRQIGEDSVLLQFPGIGMIQRNHFPARNARARFFFLPRVMQKCVCRWKAKLLRDKALFVSYRKNDYGGKFPMKKRALIPPFSSRY